MSDSPCVVATQPVVIPPQYETYRQRYEQRRVQESNRRLWGPTKKALYSHPYEELFPFFSNQRLSWEEIGAELGLPGPLETLERDLAITQRQFFPGMSRRLGVRPASSPPMKPNFRYFEALKEACEKVDLVVSPVSNGRKGHCQNHFDVGGIECVCSSFGIIVQGGNNVYATAAPLAYLWRFETTEFVVAFVNFRKPHCRRRYYIPIPVLRGMGIDGISIPLERKQFHPDSHDWEQYRDERGLALIKAAAELKCAGQK